MLMHFNGWRTSIPRVKFWMLLDELAHRVPGLRNTPLSRRICDRFDLSLGLTRVELNRT